MREKQQQQQQQHSSNVNLGGVLASAIGYHL
jgi:hypothetical protein